MKEPHSCKSCRVYQRLSHKSSLLHDTIIDNRVQSRFAFLSPACPPAARTPDYAEVSTKLLLGAGAITGLAVDNFVYKFGLEVLALLIFPKGGTAGDDPLEACFGLPNEKATERRRKFEMETQCHACSVVARSSRDKAGVWRAVSGIHNQSWPLLCLAAAELA